MPSARANSLPNTRHVRDNFRPHSPPSRPPPGGRDTRKLERTRGPDKSRPGTARRPDTDTRQFPHRNRAEADGSLSYITSGRSSHKQLATNSGSCNEPRESTRACPRTARIGRSQPRGGRAAGSTGPPRCGAGDGRPEWIFDSRPGVANPPSQHDHHPEPVASRARTRRDPRPGRDAAEPLSRRTHCFVFNICWAAQAPRVVGPVTFAMRGSRNARTRERAWRFGTLGGRSYRRLPRTVSQLPPGFASTGDPHRAPASLDHGDPRGEPRGFALGTPRGQPERAAGP